MRRLFRLIKLASVIISVLNMKEGRRVGVAVKADPTAHSWLWR